MQWNKEKSTENLIDFGELFTKEMFNGSIAVNVIDTRKLTLGG